MYQTTTLTIEKQSVRRLMQEELFKNNFLLHWPAKQILIVFSFHKWRNSKYNLLIRIPSMCSTNSSICFIFRKCNKDIYPLSLSWWVSQHLSEGRKFAGLLKPNEVCKLQWRHHQRTFFWGEKNNFNIFNFRIHHCEVGKIILHYKPGNVSIKSL